MLFPLNYYDYSCRVKKIHFSPWFPQDAMRQRLVSADETAFISGHSAFDSELIK